MVYCLKSFICIQTWNKITVFDLRWLFLRARRRTLKSRTSNTIKAVWKIGGLHGRWHAPALLAHSLHSHNVHARTHARRRSETQFPAQLQIYILECGKNVQDGKSWHLKKSLTIKSRSKRGLKMMAELHGSRDGSWNSNALSCAAVSSLISFSLSGKDLMWGSDALLSEWLNGNIHPNVDLTCDIPV